LHSELRQFVYNLISKLKRRLPKTCVPWCFALHANPISRLSSILENGDNVKGKGEQIKQPHDGEKERREHSWSLTEHIAFIF
jgi:hypothetical protein